MELQEVGKYSVEPFALERILELEMTKKVNEHARLHVRGVLQEGEEASLIGQQWDAQPIKLTQAGKTLFCGVATDLGVICESGVYYLEAEAVSWTIELDRKEKKRSFQEKGRSYQSIVNELAAEAQGTAEYTAPDKQIKNLLLQYRETDWEFLKRLASHSNSVLVADPAAETPSFSFGLAGGSSYEEETSKADFCVHKKVARYRKLSQCEDVSYQEEDAVEYTIRTEHAALEIGDQVSIQGNSLYVREVCLRLKGSVFLCFCTATTKSGICASKACHPHISGVTLDAKVLKAQNDTVKVHLSIDQAQEEGKAYPFPYATGYSAEGHTGWYVMPEIGDTVQVIFPTEDENEAYAVQSARQQDTEKTADPKVKYLRTPDGKEIKLDGEEILITANDGVTYVRINEKTGVDIYTDKEVKVISEGSIAVDSKDSISMACKNNFSIQAGKNLVITAEDSISMTNIGNNLTMVPMAGTSLAAAKPILVTSGDKIQIASKGKFSASSNNAMKLSAAKDLSAQAGKKLALSASSALQQSCRGSSIQMNGTIQMKASLIKEN
ncbi:MAG: DUF2345 domain-containing protein [Eubacterium sp.]|nr:DUF2345 domain-containing protein [Eubacterium sp.]